jgi:hypothetical protein
VRLALGGVWRGTASELMRAVERVPGAGRSGWPRTLPQFAGALRRMAPNLRAVGVNVSFEREGRCGRRMIRVSVSAPELALEAACDGPGARP